MRIRLYNVAPGVKRRKNRRAPTPKRSRRWRSRQPSAASLL